MGLPLRTQSWSRPPLTEQVARAKYLMRDSGLSMTEAARAIGVMPNELDAALWQFLGTAPEELSVQKPRPEPMF